MICALKQNECNKCILSSTCAYAYIFETAPIMKAEFLHIDKYIKIPHPFIIEPPPMGRRVIHPGEHLEFYLILLGKALVYLPYFICTFNEIGKIGLGQGRSKYGLCSVRVNNMDIYSNTTGDVAHCEHQELEILDTIYDKSDNDGVVRICFETPVRIQTMRKLATSLPFSLLVRNLLRRIGILSYYHCGGQIPEWDARSVILKAEEVTTCYNGLRWYDWERYSARQRTKMKLGGLIGVIEYSGHLSPFMSLLRAGEMLHVGKGTSFGLGRYILQNA
jgi:hypothetical protein